MRLLFLLKCVCLWIFVRIQLGGAWTLACSQTFWTPQCLALWWESGEGRRNSTSSSSNGRLIWTASDTRGSRSANTPKSNKVATQYIIFPEDFCVAFEKVNCYCKNLIVQFWSLQRICWIWSDTCVKCWIAECVIKSFWDACISVLSMRFTLLHDISVVMSRAVAVLLASLYVKWSLRLGCTVLCMKYFSSAWNLYKWMNLV